MYYVYILQSIKDKSSYAGFTEDLRKRLKVHNEGGDEYTSRKKPYILLWYSAFHSKKRALAFEKYLKSGSGRAFLKKHLIK